MHEHFDLEGQPCIAMFAHTTVVTREPEWDEATRGRALRLAEHERSIDQSTGLPIDEAYTNQPFVVHNDIVNYAARAIDRQRAKDREAHPDGWDAHRTYIAQVPSPDDLPSQS